MKSPQHLASVDIACNFCDRQGRANVGRLLSEHGPVVADANLAAIAELDLDQTGL